MVFLFATVIYLIVSYELNKLYNERKQNEESVSESDNDDQEKEVPKHIKETPKDSLKDVQIAMAESMNFEAQKLLLNSPELCAEALVIICEKPSNFNFDNDIVQKWFIDAINRTKLTSEQEIRISKKGDSFAMKKALILKKDLTTRGLIELCKSPGNMNLDSDNVRDWYLKAVNRTKPSEEEQLEMVKTQNFAILRALLLSKELKPEALVAISKCPGNLNLDNDIVRKWFEDAVQRNELTDEQQVRMVKTNNFAAMRAILLNTNISYKAFLILCQNTKYFNMQSETVQRYFKNATRRLVSNISTAQKVELAKTNVEEVITSLM